jgi:magnesium transporter
MSEHGRKRRAFQHPPPGSPPGTVVVDPTLPPPAMRVMAFGPTGLEEVPVKSGAEIQPFLSKWPVTWLDVDGLGDAKVIAELADLIGMHKLSLEDVVHVHQRSKVEDFGNYLFFVCRMPQGMDCLETEQVSLCLGKNFLVTFQETDHPGDVFERVRVRLRQAESRIRSMPADYLAYSLIDSIVDSYFPILEKYGESIDILEDQTLSRPRPETVRKIHKIKRELIAARRATWPMREMLNAALRDPTALISGETRVYLRDCYDHTVQIIDLIETYRDLASGMMELYLSVTSNRLNEIMKVLTVISTIFIPLTFIVGVYGMNFDTRSPWNMPELTWRYGYIGVLLVMALIAGVMLWQFRKRGWLGEVRRQRRRREK